MRNTYLSNLRTRWLTALVVLLLPWAAQAQVTGYTFSTGTSPFVQQFGTTSPSTPVDVNTIEADAALSAALPIGFTFNFNGVNYTTVRASSDGYLSFGTSTTNSGTNDLLTTTAARRPVIAPLWDDLDGASGSGAATYRTAGTAPNRTFTMEWLNWQWNWSATGTTISFQVTLYETTNVIEMNYRQESGAVNSGSASIGIAAVGTGVGNIQSVNSTYTGVTMVTETTNLNTKPATDTRFTWTPPTCYSGPTAVAAASGVTSSGANMSWTAPGVPPGSGYDWKVIPSTAEPTTAGVASGSTAAGVTTASASGLNPSTAYRYWVRGNCGAGSLSGWVPSAVFTTTACANDLQANSLVAPANVASGCYLSPATITAQIRNNGTGSLTFDGTSSNTVTVTTTGPNPQSYTVNIPAGTLASGATQNITLTTGYAMTAAGVHGFNVSVNMAGDCNTSNDALATVNRTVINTSLASTYFADFEPSGTLPTGWTATSYFSNSTGGNPGYSYYANYFSSTAKSLSTNPFTVNAATDSLRFDWKITDDFAGTLVQTGTFGSVLAEISTDCGGTWTTLGTLNTSSASFTTTKISLSPYVGQTVLFRWSGAWLASDWYFNIDNIVIGPIPPKSLNLSNITAVQQTGAIAQGTTGPVLRITVPVSGQTGTITMTGLTATYTGTSASDITNVRLYRTSTTTFSTTTLVSTTTLSGGTATFTLTSPQNSGANYYWLAVDVPSSGATASNSIDFSIAAGDITFTSGGGATTSGSVAAFNPTGNATVGGKPFQFGITKSNITYTSISATGTPFGWKGVSFNSNDDQISQVTPFSWFAPGFDFQFQGFPITAMRASTNGWLTLDPTVTSGSLSNNLGSDFATTRMLIAPLWDDLRAGSVGTDTLASRTSMFYRVDGTAPNRVITVEWKDAIRFGSTGNTFNYQIKLYETSYNIEILYGQMQSFNFGTPSAPAMSYSVGLKGASIAGAFPNFGESIALQFPGTNVWGPERTSVSGQGANFLKAEMDCNVKYTFTNGGSYTAPAYDPAAVPVNDEPGGAILLTSSTTIPTDVCGSVYSSRNATYSALNPQVLKSVRGGNADDDVWFTFVANSTNISIRFASSVNYQAVAQVLTVGLDTISSFKTSATGGFAVYNLSGLSIGDQYFIRVFHANTPGNSVRATATANLTSGAVSSLTLGTGGALYSTTPEVLIYGGDGNSAVFTANGTPALTSFTQQSGGTGYTVAPSVYISDPGSATTGQFALLVNATPTPPGNDNPAGASPLTVTGGGCTNQYTNVSTLNATASVAAACAGTADDDVWYKFTASATSTIINVVGRNGFDARIQVFNQGAADDTTTWNSVSCVNNTAVNGTESVTLTTVVGNVYYVRIFHTNNGNGGTTAQFNLCAFSPQPLAYEFVQSTAAYAAISGGTQLYSGTFDDDTVVVNLAAPITLNGGTFTKAVVSTNGWLALGTDNPGSFTTSALSATGSFVIVSGFGADLTEAATGTPEIRYQQVGGEQIFQWQDVSRSLSTGEQFSFQIAITTATGDVRIIYGPATPGTSTTAAQVGLRNWGTTNLTFVLNRIGNDAWSRTTTGTANSSTIATNAGNFPTSGLEFQYNVTSCVAPPPTPVTVAAADLGFNTATLRWRIRSTASNGYDVRWRRPADPVTTSTWATPTTTTASASDTSVSISSLVDGETYIFDVRARCSGSSFSHYSTATTFTTKAAPLGYEVTQAVLTYTPITGGTVIDFSSTDSDTTLVNLASSLTIGSKTYTQAQVSTNGWVRFGGTSTGSGFTTNMLTTAGGTFVMQPFGADLDQSDAVAGEVRYQKVGNDHVFQWKDWSYWLATGQRINFQARINEVTGQIRFVYDSVDAGSTGTTVVVGIRNGGTTYPDNIITRGTQDSWEKTTSGASGSTSMTLTPGDPKLFPTSGLTYQFDPTSCLSYIQQPAALVTAQLRADSAEVKWRQFATATSGYYVRWRKPSDPLTVITYATPTAVGAGVADTSFWITGLTPTTQYIFEVSARCSGTTQSNYSPARSFTTLAPPRDAIISALVSPSSGCAGGSGSVIVTIRNNGTQTILAGTNLPVSITWTGAASGSLSNTLTVASDIAPNGTVNFTVGSASTPAVGNYNFVASVNWATDLNPTNDTVRGTIAVSPTYTAPYTEGFNGTSLNSDWSSVIVQPTTTSITPPDHDGWAPDQGASFSPAITAQEGTDFVSFLGGSLSGDMVSNLFTPCFNITNACTEARWYSYRVAATSPSTGEGTRVFISVDGGAFTLATVLTGRGGAQANPILAESATIGTSGWEEYKVDLSAYSGSTVKLMFQGFSAFEANDIGIDNFRMAIRPSVDLGITAVQSPEPFPSCASANANVTISIKNFGCDTAYSTPVQVNFTGSLTQTFSATYTNKIAPGATVNFTLGTVNVSSVGTYNVAATTQTVGDGDNTNDLANSVTTVDASNVPPAATATTTPANIIVGGSTTLAATAPASGPGIFTNTTNYAINDNATFDSPITVSGVTGTANSVVRVTLNIAHTFDGDVDISLVAPDGSIIDLSSDNGGSGENYTNTIFQTGGTAITLGSAPFTGTFAPEQPFSNLTGTANGTWRLRVADDASGDQGTLLNWSITFNGVPLTNTWTLTAPPAPVAGFPFSGLNPGSRTLTTAGTYNFAFTSSYASGCSRTINLPVNVFEGNQWLGVDNTNPTNNWQNAANWAVSPAPPAPGTAITIPAGTPFQPTIDQAVTVGNLKVANGATLTVNGSGSLAINGSITGNTLANVVGIGPVSLGGSAQQTVYGLVNMNNLTVNNTNATGLTFAPGSQLRIRPGGTLTLGPNARVTIPTTNVGALVLQSDASGTARLAPVPSSALITGEIALERKLPATAGWYFVTAPFKGSTAAVNEWDEVPARVVPANNATVFEFTENNSAAVTFPTSRDTVAKFGWRPPSSLTNQIAPGDKPKGFRVYQNATLISRGGILKVTGNPITQNVTTTFTFTPTAPGGYDGGGWNLIGNPYACEIDWNAVKFDPTNAAAPSGNAVSIYNGATKLYGSYTALTATTGLAVNGASRYIASSQAFFIKASAAGSLTFKESHKNTTNGASFIRTADPDNTLRFTFSQGANNDEAAIVFLAGASQGLDQFDAKNLASDIVDGASGANLAINVMPALTQREEIPMSFKAAAGQAHVRFSGLSSFPTSARVYLRDSYLGTLTEIIDGSDYTFNVTADPASSDNARFTLVFEPNAASVKEKALATPSLSAWPNPVSSAKEVLNVQLNNFGAGKAQVVLVDVLGKPVFVANPDLTTTNALTISLKGMPAGVYTLKASSGNIAQQKQIVVE